MQLMKCLQPLEAGSALTWKLLLCSDAVTRVFTHTQVSLLPWVFPFPSPICSHRKEILSFYTRVYTK